MQYEIPNPRKTYAVLAPHPARHFTSDGGPGSRTSQYAPEAITTRKLPSPGDQSPLRSGERAPGAQRSSGRGTRGHISARPPPPDGRCRDVDTAWLDRPAGSCALPRLGAYTPAMENVVLGGDLDVIRALLLVEQGVAIRVVVDDEKGPDGPEPQVEFLRQLLDEVQRRFAVEDRQYVPHPWVDARYLRSCVIRPVPPRGQASGVREPRTPRPAPVAGRMAVDPGRA